ncbi:MAG: hypothetical protein ACREVG_07730, partial [Burkholderiales bacterium]
VNGKALIFISNADLVDTGSTGPEVFRWDLERQMLTQITNVAGVTEHPTYSAGVFTAFLSDSDLIGNGNASLSLFLVNLFALGSRTVP